MLHPDRSLRRYSTVRSYGLKSSGASRFTVNPRIYFSEGNFCEIANKT